MTVPVAKGISRRIPPWLRTLVLTAVGAVVSLRLAEDVVRGKVMPALLIIAVLAVIGLLRYPRAAAGILLFLGCTFWHSPLLPVSFGGIRSDEVELLALGLIGVWLLARMMGYRSASAIPYRWGLLLLVLAVGVGAAYSMAHTGQRAHVIADVKTFSLYLLVLPFCALFGSREHQRQLEQFVVRLATVASIGVLGAVAAGIQLEGRPGTGIDLADLAQTTRVRPALLPLLFLATMLVLASISVHGATPGRLLQMALFVAVWGISYNRSSWVALTVAALVLLAVRPGPREARRTLTAALVVVAAIPLVLGLAATGTLGSVPKTVTTRATTLFNDEAVQSNSLVDRNREYTDAFQALSQQPVFGVGVGGLYGARRPYYDADLGIIRYQDRSFSHNSWVYLYLQLGVLGLLALGKLSLDVVRSVVHRVRTREPEGALRATAASCALLGAALEAVFNPNLLLRPSIVTFAVCLALITPPSGPFQRTEARG